MKVLILIFLNTYFSMNKIFFYPGLGDKCANYVGSKVMCINTWLSDQV